MERTPAIFIAMLAIFKVGAVYVPINSKYPDEKIEFILSDCKPQIILASSSDRIPEKMRDNSFILTENFCIQAPQQKLNLI